MCSTAERLTEPSVPCLHKELSRQSARTFRAATTLLSWSVVVGMQLPLLLWPVRSPPPGMNDVLAPLQGARQHGQGHGSARKHATGTRRFKAAPPPAHTGPTYFRFAPRRGRPARAVTALSSAVRTTSSYSAKEGLKEGRPVHGQRRW